MYDCYQTVTVWNKSGTLYYRHTLPVMCKWKNKIVRSVTDSGVANVASSITVIVPYSDLYRSEPEWQKLSDSDKRTYFTFGEGDLVALGAINTDITGFKPNTKSEVKNSLMPNVGEVKVIQDNTRSAQGKHYRVEAV